MVEIAYILYIGRRLRGRVRVKELLSVRVRERLPSVRVRAKEPPNAKAKAKAKPLSSTRARASTTAPDLNAARTDPVPRKLL